MPETGFEIADRYELIRRLGGGDGAPVWQALDRASGSTVVLKLQRDAVSGAGLEAEFARLQALAHPALMKPRDFFRDRQWSCMVSDWAAAGDLGSLRGRGYRDHEYLLLKVQKATAERRRHLRAA